MRMSAIAKVKNKAAKENSKSQKQKIEKMKQNYRPRICCKKCKETKKTLYNIAGTYYCIDCKNKIK